MKFGMIVSQIILTAFLSFILVKANAATLEETQFVDGLNLSAEGREFALKSLDDAGKKQRKRMMFCTEAGVGAIGDLATISCKRKGKELTMTFAGLGGALHVHSGVAILYPKKGSRLIKEGTYRHTEVAGLHLGIGGIVYKIHNDNKSINYRLRGITLGLGINASEGILMVDDPAAAE